MHPFGAIACALVLTLGQWPVAAAAGFIREDLRIAMPAARQRGLEALLVRPDEPGPHPLVLINHGSPRDGSQRPEMTPLELLAPAIEFARRGWTAAIVMRRGFGDSGGGFAEDRAPCRDPDYLRAASASAADPQGRHRVPGRAPRHRCDPDPQRRRLGGGLRHCCADR
jgi:hypothetical protein